MIEFRVSGFCTGGGCVEVGHSPDGRVLVRDAKDPGRRVAVEVSAPAWASFLAGVRRGDFTQPQP